MIELSCIVPFVNEWPQVVFTIRSIVEELRGRVNFEIIAIDNFHPSVGKEDRGTPYMWGIRKYHPWLKVVKYNDKLSHWNAKRVGIENSSGKFLWHCDAHCMVGRGALWKMFEYYRENHESLNGTMHLPLTYQILERKKLIYGLKSDLSVGDIHYTFKGYWDADFPYEVPCMSTCGMMMTRKLYDELGGWPAELGIYGGGENFMNFALAVTGRKKWIMPGEPLYHHGDRRGYSWNKDDYVRNRTIANYLFGGVDLATRFIDSQRRGSRRIWFSILDSVLSTCEDHRKIIRGQMTEDIEDWLSNWPH